MPVGYAEARNIVFLKPAGPARSCFHENINSRQSVPFGSDLFGLRPEWISSFHSDGSAQRNRGSIPRIDVRHKISAVRLRDPAHRRCVAPDQSLCADRANDSRSHRGEHLVVSRSDGAGRLRTRASCDNPLGRCVRECQIGVRRSLSGAGQHENRTSAAACRHSFGNRLTNRPQEEKKMSRTIEAAPTAKLSCESVMERPKGNSLDSRAQQLTPGELITKGARPTVWLAPRRPSHSPGAVSTLIAKRAAAMRVSTPSLAKSLLLCFLMV
jgi:hypothetical protein